MQKSFDLSKIKAAILAAFGEICKAKVNAKQRGLTTKILFSSDGLVKRLTEREERQNTGALEDDFQIDIEGHLNYIVHEEIVEHAVTHPFENPLNWDIDDYVYDLFERAYWHAHEISSGRSSFRHHYDELKAEAIAHGDGDIRLSITTMALIADSQVALTPCVKHYLRRLQHHLKDSEFFARLKPHIESLIAEASPEQALPNPSLENSETPPLLFHCATDTRMWQERLKAYFANHLHTPLDSSKKNYVLRCMVWFIDEWERQGIIISRPNTDAVRLLERCGFQRDGVSEKKIADQLGRLRRNKAELEKEKEEVKKYIESTQKST